MRKIAVALAIVFLFLIGASPGIRAQQASVTLIYPTGNQDSVQARPTISIKTQHRFDSSSVHWPRDTAIYADTTMPTFLLLPKILSDSLPDSLHTIAAVRGEYALHGDTLQFTPFAKLAYNVQYTLKISNLRAVDDSTIGPSPDTVVVRDTSVTFRTVPDIYRTMASSAYNNPWVGCGDTITLTFDRKLKSNTTVSGELLVLERVDSVVEDTDTTWHYATTAISANTWLKSGDSSVVCLKPNSPLTPGANYLVRTYAGKLSGDTADNRSYPVRVKEYYSINVGKKNEDANSSATPSAGLLSHVGEIYARSGDTMTIASMKQDASFAFLRWECPGNPAINGSTTQVLKIVEQCNDLHDINLTAVYRKRDSITVYVQDTSNVTVYVYRYNPSTGVNDSLGGIGSYTLAPGEGIEIAARIDSTGHKDFNQWSSNYAPINGTTFRYVRVVNDGAVGSGPITVKPKTKILSTAQFGLCATAKLEDLAGSPQTVQDFSNFVTISPNPCQTASVPNQTTTVSAATVNNCYEISEIFITGPGGTGRIKPPAGTHTWSQVMPLTQPFTNVAFTIKATTYKLDLTTVLQRYHREGTAEDHRKKIGKDKDVRIEVYMVNPTTGETRLSFFSNDGDEVVNNVYTQQSQTPDKSESPNHPAEEDITYLCGEQLRIVARTDFTPEGEEGYTFVEWDNSNGWTAPAVKTTNPFDVVMDADKKVKGTFDEGFRLRMIGFYRNDHRNSEDIEWYLPRRVKRTIHDDNEIFHIPSTGYGARVRYRFSGKVDPLTVEGHFKFSDLSDRVDGEAPMLYGTWNGANVRYYEDDRAAELTMQYLTKGITKGETYRAELTNGIREQGTDHNRLKNPMSFTAETEMPGVQVSVLNITPLRSQGDGDVELATLASGGIMKEDGTWAVKLDSGTQLPDYQCYNSVPSGTTVEYNKTMFSYAKVKKTWTVRLGLSSFDIDDDHDCSSSSPPPSQLSASDFRWIGAISGLITGVFIAPMYLMTIATGLSIWGWVILGAIAVGASVYDLIRLYKWIAGADEADPMGGPIRLWVYDWSTFFGTKADVIQYHQATSDDGNIQWETEFKIKLDN